MMLSLCLSFLAHFAQEAEPRPHPPLWGELVGGPQGVGFRSQVLLDESRSYRMTLADGTRHPEEPMARPVLLNLWYPALPEAGEAMPHGDYFTVATSDEPMRRFVDALVAYGEGIVCQELFGTARESLSAADRARLERFLATPTACIRDAAPAQGRWPIVVYHAGYGSSFEDNAVLCEYLASQGFVVAGSAFQREDGASFNIDARDGTIRDVAFLLQELGRRPFADAERVAMIGHSGGAHATLLLQSRPASPLDALVSLDTTQDYQSVLDPRWDHVPELLAHPERLDVPMLVWANPHACFDLMERMRQAPRWYATVALLHNEFIAQGVLAAELRGEAQPALRDEARRVRAQYTALCQQVAAFLASRWSGAPFPDPSAASDSLRIVSVPAGEATPEYSLDAELPPTPVQLRPLLARHGVTQCVEVLARTFASAPDAPVFHWEVGFALLFELVASDRLDEARELAPLWCEIAPELTANTALLARYYTPQGPAGFAIPCNELLRLLDPENKDAEARLRTLREK